MQHRIILTFVLVSIFTIVALAFAGDPFCEGMAKADRLGCLAEKYDNYAGCQVNKTYDEDITGPGSGDAEFKACRADALADYAQCRADVDTCTE